MFRCGFVREHVQSCSGVSGLLLCCDAVCRPAVFPLPFTLTSTLLLLLPLQMAERLVAALPLRCDSVESQKVNEFLVKRLEVR